MRSDDRPFETRAEAEDYLLAELQRWDARARALDEDEARRARRRARWGRLEPYLDDLGAACIALALVAAVVISCAWAASQ